MKNLFFNLVLILILAFSFSLVSCSDDSDETNKPNNDIVSEIYSFYNKPIANVLFALDTKKWNKVFFPAGTKENYDLYMYFNNDSTQFYLVGVILNNTTFDVRYLHYGTSINPTFMKSVTNNDIFISKFADWESKLQSYFTNPTFYAYLSTDNGITFNNYYNREDFLVDFAAKRTKLDVAYSYSTGNDFAGGVGIELIDNKESFVFVNFHNSNLIINKNKYKDRKSIFLQ